MAKRKPTAPPPPFPDSIDRNYFAAWLSGFTDGEGCFRLKADPRTVGNHLQLCAEFCIGLRADDVETLHLIRSYLSCGRIYVDQRYYTAQQTAPKSTYRVSRTRELIERVIPHFDNFPLVAKKKRDFAIWREGVLLLHSIMQKRQRSKPGVGRNSGRLPKWTANDLTHYTSLVNALKKQREYEAPELTPPERPPLPPDG